MSMSFKRVVGRIFETTDLDEGTVTVLRRIADETGYGEQTVRRRNLVGDEAEAMRARWLGTCGEGIGSAWLGRDGRWRLGTDCGGGWSTSSLVESEQVRQWSRDGSMHKAAWDRIAGDFCDALPREVADHPGLGPFGHWIIAWATGDDLLTVGDVPGEHSTCLPGGNAVPAPFLFQDEVLLECLGRA